LPIMNARSLDIARDIRRMIRVSVRPPRLCQTSRVEIM
jgi:hypothetical protein